MRMKNDGPRWQTHWRNKNGTSAPEQDSQLPATLPVLSHSILTTILKDKAFCSPINR